MQSRSEQAQVVQEDQPNNHKFGWYLSKTKIGPLLARWDVQETELIYDLGHTGRLMDDFTVNADLFQGRK